MKNYSPDKIDEFEKIELTFDEVRKDGIVIPVSGKDYEVCEKTSSGDNYWANSKKGSYGKGLGRTKSDPYKPVRTGLLGQMAYTKLFGGSVDLQYRKGGDKYDALLCGKYLLDIKCAMRNYGAGLIYHKNEWGKEIPLDKDIYIFGFIDSEDRKAKICRVVFVGFALKYDIKKCEIKSGRRGNGHLNYEVPFSSLRNINDLVSFDTIFQLLDGQKKLNGVESPSRVA